MKPQVKDCLKQNEELRRMLDKLRSEQINLLRSGSSNAQLHVATEQSVSGPPEVVAENLLLKVGSW